MNKLFLPFLLFLFIGISVSGQDKTALYYANLIDSAQLKTTLSMLASDEFGGRGSGQPGETKTIQYIASLLKEKKITPANNGSYFQNIEAFNTSERDQRFVFNNYAYTNDFVYRNTSKQDSVLQASEIIFVGYGQYSRSFNEFAGIDIKDKIIMKISETPVNKFGIAYSLDNQSHKYLEANPPKAIIDIQQGFRMFSSWIESVVYSESEGVPYIQINELLANNILNTVGKTVKQIAYETEKSGSPVTQIIPFPVTIGGNFRYKNAGANNVIGVIEGSDLKDEYVVLSAHHDHLGTSYSRIYNGADDNASGVSALLEIGNILAKAKKEGKGPRRSVILLFPSAEEKGLFGSEYYVKNPIFPLEKTIACVNLDMLGRIDFNYENKGNHYVYLINQNSGYLPHLAESINKNTLNLTLDFGKNNWFYQSDQYNFSKERIPSIMLSSGEHKDYHESTDDVEFIDFDGLHKRTKLAFLIAWELANKSNFDEFIMNTY